MTRIDRRGKSAARTALSVALLAAAAGCTAKWALRTVEPTLALQWPFQPNPAKLTYLGSLTGLEHKGGSGSAFRAFVYGRDGEERNAFVLPVAVATAADGRIAVADMARKCVHLYVPSEKRYDRLTGSATDTIASPVAVIFDDEMRLYLSDSTGKVLAFGPDGALLYALHKAGTSDFLRPTGLAYSPAARLLYVVDTLANRVHAFHPAGDHAFSFGERGEEEGRFNFPTHIFRSASGELYVTDALNFRIGIFDETGRPLGSFGRHGDGSGDLAMPKGLAVDRDGVVYVADAMFDNVQLFSRDGEFLLTLGKRGADSGEFWLPSGLFISDGGELYVCDTYNRRIQVFRIAEGYATRT